MQKTKGKGEDGEIHFKYNNIIKCNARSCCLYTEIKFIFIILLIVNRNRYKWMLCILYMINCRSMPSSGRRNFEKWDIFFNLLSINKLINGEVTMFCCLVDAFTISLIFSSFSSSSSSLYSFNGSPIDRSGLATIFNYYYIIVLNWFRFIAFVV